MGILVLLRHGQSLWNLENKFTGWTDVPLTEQGAKDAKKTGAALKGMKFDVAFTSRLVRAKDTMDIVLKEMKQSDIPTVEDSALNERHYGDLQGLNKAEMAVKYGQDQVKLWRRSYFTQPPNGESLEDTERRVMPFFHQYIMPHVEKGETVLVASHGNSQRPIMKYLENLEPEFTATMEIGLCTPYIYTFEGKKLVKKDVLEVPGIVTKGASTTESRVEKGRV